MNTVRLTTAQALLRFLDNQYVELDGCEHKFVRGVLGIFGHGNVTGMGQALEQGDTSLTYYQCHSEQGMVHTATAFARQLDRLGILVCTSSIGPGALNMVTGAATATVNRIPVLLIPGDIFACRQPDPVLQQLEAAHDGTISANDAFRPVSRYFDRLTRPDMLMSAAIAAMRVLTDPAETGAVTLALPQDVGGEAYDYPEAFFARRVHRIERRAPDVRALADAVRAIEKSRRPLLIVGGGVQYSRAAGEAVAFAEAFGVPAADTQAGRGVFSYNHPLYLGGIGGTGTRAANLAARDADLIIGVGTRFSDFTTSSKTGFAEDARVLSVNVAALENTRLDAIGVRADAKLTLAAMTGALSAKGYKATACVGESGGQEATACADGNMTGGQKAADAYAAGEIARLRAEWDAECDRLYAIERPDGLAQTRALGVVNAFAGPEDIVVGASGSLPGCMQRLWRHGDRKSYHMEYGFSCMGYEVSGAVGVKMAMPDREVYAMLGDGSYIMLHSELLTSIQEGCKINVVLMDNHGFQCINSLQVNKGAGRFGNDLRFRDRASGLLTGAYVPVDFAMYARALGAVTYTVTTADELRAALADAKRQTVSTLIDIKTVPGSHSGGYESWWRTGVAEVAAMPGIEAVRAEHDAMLKKARKW